MPFGAILGAICTAVSVRTSLESKLCGRLGTNMGTLGAIWATLGAISTTLDTKMGRPGGVLDTRWARVRRTLDLGAQKLIRKHIWVPKLSTLGVIMGTWRQTRARRDMHPGYRVYASTM